MRLRNMVTLLIGVFLISFPMHSAKADDYLERCISQSSGTSSDHYRCATDLWQREDTALNQTWQRVYGSMSQGHAKSALLNEQRAWNAYKDSACEFYAEEFGSIGWSVSRPMCKAEKIKERIRDLEEYESYMK